MSIVDEVIKAMSKPKQEQKHEPTAENQVGVRQPERTDAPREQGWPLVYVSRWRRDSPNVS